MSTASQVDATRESLRIELLQLMAQVRAALQKWSAAYARSTGVATSDIFRGQGRALALLAENGEMRQRDMCHELGIRPQSLGEVLTKLERAGLVARRRAETDRRALMVRITPTGIEEVEKSRPHNLLSSFSEDEIIQFASFLRRAIAEIDERREELEGAPDGEAPADPSGGE